MVLNGPWRFEKREESRGMRRMTRRVWRGRMCRVRGRGRGRGRGREERKVEEEEEEAESDKHNIPLNG